MASRWFAGALFCLSVAAPVKAAPERSYSEAIAWLKANAGVFDKVGAHRRFEAGLDESYDATLEVSISIAEEAHCVLIVTRNDQSSYIDWRIPLDQVSPEATTVELTTKTLTGHDIDPAYQFSCVRVGATPESILVTFRPRPGYGEQPAEKKGIANVCFLTKALAEEALSALIAAARSCGAGKKPGDAAAMPPTTKPRPASSTTEGPTISVGKAITSSEITVRGAGADEKKGQSANRKERQARPECTSCHARFNHCLKTEGNTRHCGEIADSCSLPCGVPLPKTGSAGPVKAESGAKTGKKKAE